MKNHPKRGKIISDLLNQPQRLLITILICNLFVNIMATFVANALFPRWLAFIIITASILIFGEVTPKAIALRIGPSVSLIVAPLFFFLSHLLFPVIFVIRAIATSLVKFNSMLFHKNTKEPTHFNSAEMLDIIKTSETGGILTKEESNILGNLLEFENSDLIKIARPRNEIFSLPIDTELQQIVYRIKERKFSRIPIWEKNEDNIIGILFIKDLLKLEIIDKQTLFDHKQILRKPYFVPDTVKAEKLLIKLQNTRNRMAIVINEYGDISGLVTIEDLLEEIIGEVVDKDDIKPLYYQYDPSIISIEAKMELSEFNEVFTTNLQDDEAVSVGGFILQKIKRIPAVGETIEIENLKFKITGAKPNKIENIMVTKIQKYKRNKKKLLDKVR